MTALNAGMTETQHIYQAIGELEATLVSADDGTKFLQTESRQYLVSVPLKIAEKYQNNYQGQLVFWRVYPQVVDNQLAFKVVTLALQPKIGHGRFKLQGDWVESGAIQIWRNVNARQLNTNNWQPRSLPITWDSAPTPDRAFWQLQAELIDGTLKIVAASGPFPHPPRLEKYPKSTPRTFPLERPVLKSKLVTTTESKPVTTTEPIPVTMTESKPVTITESIFWEELTPVSGKLELTIKLNTLPQVTKTNGLCHFRVDCDGRVIQVSVKQKQWGKLETANATYPEWVGAITGVMGAATADGFVLDHPSIQVFERRSTNQSPEPKPVVETKAPVESTQIDGAQDAPAIAQVKVTQAETQLELPAHPTLPLDSHHEPKPKKIGKFNVQVK